MAGKGGKHKNQRQTRAPDATGAYRFQSILTRELLEELCKTHAEGKDFRNITACRCGVHPKLLSSWLRLGRDNENAGLATELFLRFGEIEGDIRAGLIAEAADPTASVENTEFEDGKPVSKTLTSRRTSGVQWLMERRFHQFRTDHVAKEDELEIAAMLEPQAVTYTADMVLGIVQQMAAHPERLPEAVRKLFAQTDWRVPLEMTDGKTKTN